MAKTDVKTKQPVKNPDKNQEVIYAAGGIIWRREGLLMKIALVQRPKYNDICLPKGKMEEGETLDQTALREVGEETGSAGRIIGFADSIDYKVNEKMIVIYHS